MSKLNIGQILNDVKASQLKANVLDVHTGDWVVVSEKIIEGNKTRIQKFEGIVMRVRGEGLQTTFIVRKDVSGVFVEKSFFLHSPLVVDVKFLKHTPVRRNYISYIRNSKKKITM